MSAEVKPNNSAFGKDKTPSAVLPKSDDDFVNLQKHDTHLSYTITFYPATFEEINTFLEEHQEFGTLSELLIKATQVFIRNHREATERLKNNLLKQY
ncbi:MAG: hypothetical protein HC842_05915 [Cytophagales bacterium]|nr:hypothetical protein [Cytophagales bacterium]